MFQTFLGTILLCGGIWTSMAQFPVDPKPLSLHVVDQGNGNGAAFNVTCKLLMLDTNGNFTLLSEQATDDFGAIPVFLPVEDFEPGTYRIRCKTKQYFAVTNTPTFYPHMQVTFNLQDPHKDYHLVIQLSPFGFMAYRGV